MEADSLPAGTAVVGDFANFSAVHDRRDVEVQMGNQHGTYFTAGRVAIRADLRLAFVVYRPAAFSVITGI